ncbi:DUF1592 domain-containing protein [Pedosphaera parvula]|uniref:Cytochrome c domain-containing protein n=1 Tax=Pedosphaera parvula (strain Ellin514) TaxID=320771 RepID=B9XP91_PEDPL|nr:DUF1592 domain-containing protein [Pedosphaera parvula]EEF58342.1 Protein of unknown function DUF1588 [Pedosphaera parvula Ellin514]
MMIRAFILVLCLFWGLQSSPAAARLDSSSNPKVTFEKNVKPLLSQYCFGCHGEKKKGDLDLRIYTNDALVKKDRDVFEKVLHNLQAHEMPPESKPQPSSEEREIISHWIEAEVLGCDCNQPDPGRVTMRRLNRTEYNNTIRDLVGVDFQPADDFPVDDVGYGFDNIGDVLSLSPMLMEKYFVAAEKILDAAIVTTRLVGGPTNHFKGDRLKGSLHVDELEHGAKMLSGDGEVYATNLFSKAGKYILRVKAAGQQAGPDLPKMEVRLDDKVLRTLEVKAPKDDPKVYEIEFDVNGSGGKKIAAAFINDYYDEKNPDPAKRDRNLMVRYIDVVGPLELEPLPESHKRIFTEQPSTHSTNQVAQKIIERFAKRAYRRPLSTAEFDRLFQFFKMAQKDGESFETSVKVALQAVLVSPHFLFRGESKPNPNNSHSIHPIDEFALATRLSYFLWSSMPDDELFKLAERGKLHGNLDAQVTRMLKDPKAGELVKNFADQWLQIRNLAAVTPDPEVFPQFTDKLRSAMEKETELYFGYVMEHDRSILEFIDSDYTFLNEPLAKLYGIPGVSGDEFRRVTFKNHERGGLLTQASVLTVTSNPTRTSPVKRGKWVLETILGAPPPPPPPNVPALSNDKKVVASGTMRQRMEQHRADPMCASCHARMDPIGFGFENFDAIGAWRTKEGTFDLDTTGKLVTGESFQGVQDLKRILLKDKRDAFVHCLSEKMLTYALGRGMEFYDKCAVDEITKTLAKNDFKFSSLVLSVVKSSPFRMSRGEEDKVAESGGKEAKGN